MLRNPIHGTHAGQVRIPCRRRMTVLDAQQGRVDEREHYQNLEPGELGECDQDVEHSRNRQGQEDGTRQRAGRVVHFLGDVDHILEADEGVERQERAEQDALPDGPGRPGGTSSGRRTGSVARLSPATHTMNNSPPISITVITVAVSTDSVMPHSASPPSASTTSVMTRGSGSSTNTCR